MHCYFVPPYVEERIGSSQSAPFDFRDQRRLTANLTLADIGENKSPVIVWDCENQKKLRVRKAEKNDPVAKMCQNFAQFCITYFERVLGRSGINGQTVNVNIHFGRSYNNAFWQGTELVIGDGDGSIFKNFGESLEVMAHEMGHGVVHNTANLKYEGQSGALNEHFADVFGISCQAAYRNRNDWLIGNEVMGPKAYGESLRHMMFPGSAFNNPVMGIDQQPAYMKDFYDGPADNGGVHINSGIMNRLFALTCLQIEIQYVVKIWYSGLLRMEGEENFSSALAKIIDQARRYAAIGSAPTGAPQAIRWAARQVGLL